MFGRVELGVEETDLKTDYLQEAQDIADDIDGFSVIGILSHCI